MSKITLTPQPPKPEGVVSEYWPNWDAAITACGRTACWYKLAEAAGCHPDVAHSVFEDVKLRYELAGKPLDATMRNYYTPSGVTEECMEVYDDLEQDDLFVADEDAVKTYDLLYDERKSDIYSAVESALGVRVASTVIRAVPDATDEEIAEAKQLWIEKETNAYGIMIMREQSAVLSGLNPTGDEEDEQELRSVVCEYLSDDGRGNRGIPVLIEPVIKDLKRRILWGKRARAIAERGM